MMKNMRRRHYLSLVGAAAVFFAVAPWPAFAASLFFSPSAKAVAVGNTFTVSVDVSSPDQAMNAASGDISFPTDKLRVLSVLTTGSAMSLWVQNPSFSNAAGSGDVNFAGIVLNPGFTGTAGNVVTVRFEALAVGDAPLSFSDGSVLANDGNGTNIISSLGKADITIVPTVAVSSPSANPAVATTTPTSTCIIVVAPTSTPSSTVTGKGWFSETSQALIEWGALILLGLLLLAVIFAVAYYLIHHLRRMQVDLHRKLSQEKREFRDDLLRIEKEFAAAHPDAKTDFDSGAFAKEQGRIRKEIERLEEDLKQDG